MLEKMVMFIIKYINKMFLIKEKGFVPKNVSLFIVVWKCFL